MERIYLDHAAAMPVDPRVLDAALPYLTEKVGNPSSLYHEGLTAKSAIEEARGRVADLINAEDTQSIIFTSGATESNNIAVRGTALRNIRTGKKVAASTIEHISVINPAKDLQKSGFEFARIPVDTLGVVDLEALSGIVTPETTVTSIMYANNEIGTVEPIPEIAGIVHDRGVYLHVDAADAAGRIPIDVQRDGIDLLTLSANRARRA